MKIKMIIYSMVFVIMASVKNISGYIHFQFPIEALRLAASYLPKNPIIIEAGSYDGTDCIEILRFFPKSTIYAFEPIPYLYKKLVAKAKRYPGRIYTSNKALSDSVGIADMYVSEEPGAPGIPSQSSSLLAPKDHLIYSGTLFKEKIEVQTTTIDAWAAEQGINRIDFMWLDMQGYELHALKASPNILKTVKVILTEVEHVEAYAGQYLFKDMKEWLESEGFTMIAENFGTFGNWFGDALFVRK
jgi:FkbM family methyltransferase